MRQWKRPALLAAVVMLAASGAPAQTTRYDVKTMNFDLWCQEQEKLPPERCDKRTPQDEKTFEAYRAKIEKYEIPYLARKQKEQQFDKSVLHNDPIDNPIDKDSAAQQQAPSPQTGEPQQ